MKLRLRRMVAAVRRWDPGIRISTTEAKRILARWRGKDRTTTLLGGEEQILTGEAASPYLGKINALREQLADLKGLPRPPKPTAGSVKVSPFGIGPVPRYKRVNSREN